MEFAAVVQGDVPGDGVHRRHSRSQGLFADRDVPAALTASADGPRATACPSRSSSLDPPNSFATLECRCGACCGAARARARHGYLTGDVAGVTPGAMHATRVTRRIRRQELWDAVVEGEWR